MTIARFRQRHEVALKANCTLRPWRPAGSRRRTTRPSARVGVTSRKVGSGPLRCRSAACCSGVGNRWVVAPCFLEWTCRRWDGGRSRCKSADSTCYRHFAGLYFAVCLQGRPRFGVAGLGHLQQSWKASDGWGTAVLPLILGGRMPRGTRGPGQPARPRERSATAQLNSRETLTITLWFDSLRDVGHRGGENARH